MAGVYVHSNLFVASRPRSSVPANVPATAPKDDDPFILARPKDVGQVVSEV